MFADPRNEVARLKHEKLRERMDLPPECLFFVYRHPEENHSKRVVTLKSDSPLNWFRWFRAQIVEDQRGSFDPDDFEQNFLGGLVYGFAGLFAMEFEQSGLPTIDSLDDLSDFIEITYNNEFRISENSVRVLSDDDEVDLCYSFFTAEYAQQHMDRVCYLLHDSVELPTDWALGTFEPGIDVITNYEVEKQSTCDNAVFFVDLEMDEVDYLDCENASKIPGILLSGLEQFLREQWTEHSDDYHFYRCGELVSKGLGLREAWLEIASSQNAKCVVFTEHFAQIDHKYFLFDNYWAAAQPKLASSLLYAVNSWDPFVGL